MTPLPGGYLPSWYKHLLDGDPDPFCVELGVVYQFDRTFRFVRRTDILEPGQSMTYSELNETVTNSSVDCVKTVKLVSVATIHFTLLTCSYEFTRNRWIELVVETQCPGLPIVVEPEDGRKIEDPEPQSAKVGGSDSDTSNIAIPPPTEPVKIEIPGNPVPDSTKTTTKPLRIVVDHTIIQALGNPLKGKDLEQSPWATNDNEVGVYLTMDDLMQAAANGFDVSAIMKSVRAGRNDPLAPPRVGGFYYDYHLVSASAATAELLLFVAWMDKYGVGKVYSAELKEFLPSDYSPGSLLDDKGYERTPRSSQESEIDSVRPYTDPVLGTDMYLA